LIAKLDIARLLAEISSIISTICDDDVEMELLATDIDCAFDATATLVADNMLLCVCTCA
jgi:hypothetical protein